MIVLKGGWQRPGATGRMGESGARAAGLNPSCTLDLQRPDAQATPETDSIRISGDGSQASIFLKTLSRCQHTAEAEKMRSRREQGFSNFSVHTNYLEMLLKCRFWSVGLGWGGSLVLTLLDCTLSSKYLEVIWRR